MRAIILLTAITLTGCTSLPEPLSQETKDQISQDANEFMTLREQICSTGKFNDLLTSTEKAITCKNPRAEML